MTLLPGRATASQNAAAHPAASSEVLRKKQIPPGKLTFIYPSRKMQEGFF
jgi:hypothetical protein